MSVVASQMQAAGDFGLAETAPRLNLPQPTPRIEPTRAVQLCYTLMDAARAAGIHDLADGEYLPADRTLEEGIARQNEYLLDEVGCTRPGFRLLEIGCGYGRLLRTAQARGARAVGVNVSAEQVEYCRAHGSEVYCCTYRDLLESPAWHGQFDGVVANGSLEHWVQPEDVQMGEADAIYRESFEIAYKALDPAATEARYVTTAIHVEHELDPRKLLTPWRRFPRGSAERQFSLLHHWFGGYYPTVDQLPRCASPLFMLEHEADGTEGYRIASEHRMRMMLRGLRTNPKLVWSILKVWVRHPWATSALLNGYFIEQAWDWQFRGNPPPTTLLRQTWKRRAV